MAPNTTSGTRILDSLEKDRDNLDKKLGELANENKAILRQVGE